MQDITTNLAQSAHLIVLLSVGLALMLADAFRAPLRVLGIVAAVGLMASAVAAIPGGPFHAAYSQPKFGGMILFGGTASLVHIFLCGIALMALFFIGDYFWRMHKPVGEVFALMYMSLIGMSLLACANDLIILFIGLEIMSVSLYVMAALFKRDLRSTEAGFKYFLLGAFASGFLLYGIALLYGITGATDLSEIRMAIFPDDPATSITSNLLFYPAIGFILIGFLFKVAAFPFHAWTPDVYAGAPTPVAGFMATGGKMAAFVSLTFFLMNALPNQTAATTTVVLNKGLVVIAIAALGSMIYGNAVALRQQNVKRMLAYSSIAHSGYLLLGLAAGPEGQMNALYYILIYAVTTLGAFGVVSAIEQNGQNVEINNLRGLGREKPWLAAAMAVFMLSLAGIPPLGGFLAKYFVFGAALQAGREQGSTLLIALAIIGILTSVVGVYYYLRVIGAMYFRQKPEPAALPTDGANFHSPLATPADTSPAYAAGILPIAGAILLSVLVIALGVFPGPLFETISTFYGHDGFLTKFMR